MELEDAEMVPVHRVRGQEAGAILVDDDLQEVVVSLHGETACPAKQVREGGRREPEGRRTGSPTEVMEVDSNTEEEEDPKSGTAPATSDATVEVSDDPQGMTRCEMQKLK